MKFQLNEFHHNVSEDEMITDIKRVATDLKKSSVTMEEYEKFGKYHPSTLTRKIGSWFDILEKAGMEMNRSPINIPEEELFKNLEEVWIKLGKQPGWIETRTPLSKYSADTYAKRFGSWRNALERFVVYINNEEDASSAEAVESLKVEPTTKHKTSRGINWRLRFIVMRKDNFKCQSCGRSPATDPSIILHVDHIKAWANGGETVIENLQTLCSVCNIGKSDLE
ncbi:MAG: HNH endonuclease [Candidatus Saccharibacteria bacterium]